MHGALALALIGKRWPENGGKTAASRVPRPPYYPPSHPPTPLTPPPPSPNPYPTHTNAFLHPSPLQCTYRPMPLAGRKGTYTEQTNSIFTCIERNLTHIWFLNTVPYRPNQTARAPKGGGGRGYQQTKAKLSVPAKAESDLKSFDLTAYSSGSYLLIALIKKIRFC
jgi:hypothetical protein